MAIERVCVVAEIVKSAVRWQAGLAGNEQASAVGKAVRFGMKAMHWMKRWTCFGALAAGLFVLGCTPEPATKTETPKTETPKAGTPSTETPKEPVKTTTETPAKTSGSSDTVKIGVLHSLSGTMAISETSLRDVVLMAVGEINKAGGVLGKQIEPVVVDPASDWPLFAEKAKELINTDHVAVTFGCWTSVSRKSVLPVFEEYNQLLFYPVQYEGEEQSLNVFYTGAAPNQQLIPAAEYMMDAGLDEVLSAGHRLRLPAHRQQGAEGVTCWRRMCRKRTSWKSTRPSITRTTRRSSARSRSSPQGGKACVLSTINGDSNVPFYKEFANQGLTSARLPDHGLLRGRR